MEEAGCASDTTIAPPEVMVQAKSPCSVKRRGLPNCCEEDEQEQEPQRKKKKEEDVFSEFAVAASGSRVVLRDQQDVNSSAKCQPGRVRAESGDEDCPQSENHTYEVHSQTKHGEHCCAESLEDDVPKIAILSRGRRKNVVCAADDDSDCNCPSCSGVETIDAAFWDAMYQGNQFLGRNTEYLLTFKSLERVLKEILVPHDSEENGISSATVLNPGCGDSAFAFEMYKATPFKKVVNVDISEVAVQVLRMKYAEECPEMSFIRDDVIQPNVLFPASFDFILDKSLFDCLTYCSEDEVVPEVLFLNLFNSYHRLLRPGGYCIVTACTENWPRVFLPFVNTKWVQLNSKLSELTLTSSVAPWEIISIHSILFEVGTGEKVVHRDIEPHTITLHFAQGNTDADLSDPGLAEPPSSFAQFWVYTLRKKDGESDTNLEPELPKAIVEEIFVKGKVLECKKRLEAVTLVNRAVEQWRKLIFEQSTFSSELLRVDASCALSRFQAALDEHLIASHRMETLIASNSLSEARRNIGLLQVKALRKAIDQAQTKIVEALTSH